MALASESVPSASSEGARQAAGSHAGCFAAAPLCATRSRSRDPPAPHAAIAAAPASAMIVTNALMILLARCELIDGGIDPPRSHDAFAITLHAPERRRDEWRAS